MRQLQLIFVFLLFLLGCKTRSARSNQDINQAKIQTIIGAKFFDYDQIDYYHNNFKDGPEAFERLNNYKTEIDSIKWLVLVGDTPADISDTSFIDQLEKIDFTKKSIDKSAFSKIDEIFREKKVDILEAHACVHIYRDVLAFKKHDKIIGIAKICFSCGDHIIRGTTLNTNSFGQEGDYANLEKLLR